MNNLEQSILYVYNHLDELTDSQLLALYNALEEEKDVRENKWITSLSTTN